jgi:hypothetical protein
VALNLAAGRRIVVGADQDVARLRAL